MSTYIGNKIKLSIFGQSHSKAIGVCIDGIPAGIPIDMDFLNHFLDRRCPKLKSSTSRIESDTIELLSGVVDNHSCGTAFCAIINNKEQKSSEYTSLFHTPRPSHCDYPAYIKYGKYHDFAGGGHFSGRLTAALCLAGGIFIPILNKMGIAIAAHISNIGSVYDKRFNPVTPGEEMQNLSPAPITVINHTIINEINAEINNYAKNGNSIGGSIECAVTGLPVGAGSTMFDSFESRISQIVFAIPAVKGIEFGNGFLCSKMSGSDYNDCYKIENENISTKTNHCGGILGGLSNAMPLIFRAAFKPTPSITIPQDTINMETKENTTITIKGRHDACIVPRAVPVVEAAAAIACYDLIES